MNIFPNDTIVFYGDSITDHGRDKNDPNSLGTGYVSLIAARLESAMSSPDLKIYNRGISGNRIYDLEERLEKDVLSLSPTVVSFLIGINDTWRAYDRNVPSPIPEFQACFHRILQKLKESGVREFILLEPFLLAKSPEQALWRADLNPRIDCIRQLAVEFRTHYVPLDGLFAEAATKAPWSYWIPDGVHPARPGDGLISQAWMERTRPGRG